MAPSIEFLVGFVLSLSFLSIMILGGFLAVVFYKFRTGIPFVVATTMVATCLIGVICMFVVAINDFSIPLMAVIAGLVGAPSFGLILIWQIRYLRKPLAELTKLADSVSKGNLSKGVERSHRGDEFAIAINGFADMYDSLLNVLTRTSSVASHLTTSSQEVASSAEEVNASSEEISSIAQQMSRGSQNQAQQTNTVVIKAERLKKQFSKQVGEISATSDLIATISGQVNMLALNASIEAARAGEYGRGFAVVADNIRRLADETNQSLVSVNQIIDTMSQAISETILDIIDSVQNIASISEETSAGAEEASAATEEQAATMEEMSASSQELAKLALDLEALVKYFTLPNTYSHQS